jgi:signal transduction histidine kinase
MSDLNQQIHDIRKPLNIISMQAELIKMLTESSENSAQLEASANKIIQNSKHCSELLQHLFESISADHHGDKAKVNAKHKGE